MARKLIVTCGAWLVVGVLLGAADFWAEKPFMTWSDKDVEKMMNDSPWAKRVTVVFPRPPQAGPEAGAGGRGRGGEGFGSGSPQARLVISWRSALPVREALVRAQAGENAEVTTEVQEALAISEPAYYVAVTGVPPQFGRLSPEALMAEARLEIDDREPILPSQAGAQPDGRGVALVYIFPKDAPIVLEDEEVEFVAKVGDATIKKKFDLEDMVFKGQLEL